MNQHIRTLFFCLLCIGLTCYSCTNEEEEVEINEPMSVETSENKPKKVLRHIVLFKFKEDAPEAEVQKISDAFNTLPAAIPVIKDFEWGLNDSTEDLSQGFTHCYIVTFASKKDLDVVYKPHTAHQAFVKSLEPYLEKALVVDYWTK